jgi:hypothetical protein
MTHMTIQVLLTRLFANSADIRGIAEEAGALEFKNATLKGDNTIISFNDGTVLLSRIPDAKPQQDDEWQPQTVARKTRVQFQLQKRDSFQSSRPLDESDFVDPLDGIV